MGYEFLNRTNNQIILAVLGVVVSIIIHYFLAVDLSNYTTIHRTGSTADWYAVNGVISIPSKYV